MIEIKRPLIWLAGDVHDADFAAPLEWLSTVARCESVEDVRSVPETGEFPAEILFFQSRPGTVTQDAIEVLHRRAPLAQLVVLAGPWCEGELRSGRPAHGVARILWHQWPVRLRRELGLDVPAQSATLYLLRTGTDVDRLLLTIPAQRSPSNRLAAISTTRRESFGALADACAIAGCRASWQQPELPAQPFAADLLLIDGWQSLPAGFGSVGSVRVILLLDWPRPDDFARAAELGIDCVLAQPTLLADLVAALREQAPNAEFNRASSAA